MSESRLTVGEDRLRQLFAELKLDLIELLAKKADLSAHELLDHRVRVLELWQAGLVATENQASKLSGKQLALAAIGIALFVGVLQAVATVLAKVI